MKTTKKMIRLAFVAALWLLGSSGAAMADGFLIIPTVKDGVKENPSGLRLHAWLEKAKVNVGEPVVLHFAVRNESKTDVNLDRHLDDLPELEYYPEVQSSAGKFMPLTEYGKRLPGIWACEVVGDTIKSGEEIHNTLLVNQINDMTSAGKYTVRLKTYLFGGRYDDEHGPRLDLRHTVVLDMEQPFVFEVASNAVEIEVVQPQRGQPEKPRKTQQSPAPAGK